jgi:hypothetical protein
MQTWPFFLFLSSAGTASNLVFLLTMVDENCDGCSDGKWSVRTNSVVFFGRGVFDRLRGCRSVRQVEGLSPCHGSPDTKSANGHTGQQRLKIKLVKHEQLELHRTAVFQNQLSLRLDRVHSTYVGESRLQ